jgi:hypothetical protein
LPRFRVYNAGKKNAIFCLLLSLLICFSFCCNVEADQSAASALLSYGKIIYDRASTPLGNNLAPIPDKWTGKGFQIDSTLKINGTVVENTDILYPSDKYNESYSIRLTQTLSWKAEVNGPWIRVYPGDRVIMRCWIKTTADIPENVYSGARIGWDYYSELRIGGAASEAEAENGLPNSPINSAANEANMVLWGNTKWVLREWDVIIPGHVTADGWLTTGYPAGQKIVPAGIVPWMQILGSNVQDNAGYFANFELYINRNQD